MDLLVKVKLDVKEPIHALPSYKQPYTCTHTCTWHFQAHTHACTCTYTLHAHIHTTTHTQLATYGHIMQIHTVKYILYMCQIYVIIKPRRGTMEHFIGSHYKYIYMMPVFIQFSNPKFILSSCGWWLKFLPIQKKFIKQGYLLVICKTH